MSTYVTMMPFAEAEEEFAHLWNEENEQYAFSSVDCSKGMLRLIEPKMWYKVQETDEDRDIVLSMLFGTYPKELILEIKED